MSFVGVVGLVKFQNGAKKVGRRIRDSNCTGFFSELFSADKLKTDFQ